MNITVCKMLLNSCCIYNMPREFSVTASCCTTWNGCQPDWCKRTILHAVIDGQPNGWIDRRDARTDGWMDRFGLPSPRTTRCCCQDLRWPLFSFCCYLWFFEMFRVFSLLSSPCITSSCSIVLNSVKIHSPLLAQCKSRQESSQRGTSPLRLGYVASSDFLLAIGWSGDFVVVIVFSVWSDEGQTLLTCTTHGSLQSQTRLPIATNERTNDWLICESRSRLLTRKRDWWPWFGALWGFGSERSVDPRGNRSTSTTRQAGVH